MSQSPSSDELVSRGRQLHDGGHFKAAEALYRQALMQDSDHAEALHLLGVLAIQYRRYELAQELILRAIEQNPGDALYFSNLGEACRALRQTNAALEAYRQALVVDPHCAAAFYHSGQLFLQLNRLGESEQAFLSALGAYQRVHFEHPEIAHVWNNLGLVYQKQNLPDRAIGAMKNALALKPSMDHAWHNLGTIYADLSLFEEAEQAYRESLKENPAAAQTHKNLGIALQRGGRVREGIAAFEEAIRLQPDYADAHWNLSLALLLAGEYGRGWEEYEWRWKYGAFGSPVRDFAQPLWKGEDLTGKAILLHTEQAFGDAIQFARYVALVAGRGPDKIFIECQRDLAALFQRIPHVTQVFERFASLPGFDCQAPFLSLPLAFETTLQTIPSEVPYLTAPDEKVGHFKAMLEQAGAAGTRLRVGLAWAGSSVHPYDHQRSVALRALASLLAMESMSFVSLHKERLAMTGEYAARMTDMSEHLGDYSDTAALILNLDLVITVDTSMAHLAGALGKPTFVLLPFSPDWRWLLGRSDSPWYPTVRLFRQREPGKWDGVIGEVEETLRLYLAREREGTRPSS